MWLEVRTQIMLSGALHGTCLERKTVLLELVRFSAVWIDIWWYGKWIILTLESVLNDCSIPLLRKTEYQQHRISVFVNLCVRGE